MRKKILLPLLCLGFALSGAPNPEKVAAVKAGRIDTAYASWWGFDETDSAEFLQAAINSGAKKVIVDYTGKDWITGKTLILPSNLELVIADKVTLTHAVAKVTLKTTSTLGAGDKVSLDMTDVADTWNVQAGTASGDASLTYGYTLALNTFVSADGTEVTTFYVPAPAEGANSNMTLTYTKAGSSTPGTTAINNVPLKADYRTVLCGDVASLFEGETISITATMEKAWNDQDEVVEFPETPGVITVTEPGTLTE